MTAQQHQVFQFGGREFVSGLFWQTVVGAKQWRKDARAQAKVHLKDMDLMTFCQIREPHGVSQVGYASASSGAKACVASIASAVAKTMAERHEHSNWLAIFEVAEGKYVFLAVLKDAVLPEGDFFGSREEVLEKFSQEYTQSNQWEAIYAPADLGLDMSEEVRLQDLLPTKAGKVRLEKSWLLESITPSVPWKKLAVGASVGILALASIQAVSRFQQDREAAARRAAAEQLAKIGIGDAEPIVLPEPWKSTPIAAQVALSCLTAIERMPIAPGGWDLERAECLPGSVTFHWTRGESNVAFIRAALPAVVLGAAGDKASYTLSLRLPPPPADDPIAVMSEGKLALLALAQSMDLRGAFTESPESDAKNAQGRRVIKSWKTVAFALSGEVTPWDFAAAAAHIHGLRLNKASLAGSQWKLEGELYGK